MQWIRLDTALPRNPKILDLLARRDGHRAIAVYIMGLAYSGEQGTDGFIPRIALPLVHGRSRDACALVGARLWREEPGGWVIHGWTERQESTADTQERSIRARAAAAARWG